MSTRTVVCAGFALLLAHPVLAWPGPRWIPPTTCRNTAHTLLPACEHDAAAGYGLALASCANLASAHDRGACREEAGDIRREAAEECEDQLEARIDVCEILDEHRYDPDPLLDPEIAFVDPDEIPGVHPPNPFFSLEVGHTYVLRAGAGFEEIVVVTVTAETRAILGVACRVVVDAAVIAEGPAEGIGAVDYVPLEITDDLYAQDEDRNVYYCGEVSRNFEDGYLDNLDGSFIAGVERAKSGVLIRANPVPGAAHRQEFALGEAEDAIRYEDLAAIPGEDVGGENPAFPCAPEGCLETLDFSALSPSETESKFYKEGVGFVLAVAFEDGEPTGEREELVCAGDSLDILSDEACGIEDPAALRAVLCAQSPAAFCNGAAAAKAPGRSARVAQRP